MKKTIPLLSLIFAVLIGLTVWLSVRDHRPPSLDLFLQQKLPQAVDGLKSQATLDFGPFVSDLRPPELMNVDLLLPHYQDYDYRQLKSLLDYGGNCLKAPQTKISVELEKAFTWIGFACGKQSLPKDFFKKPPYLFPSGKSFVQMATERSFDFTNYLSEKEIETYKSLPEVLSEALKVSDLNLQQLKGLINAEDFLVGDRFVYVKHKNSVDSPVGKIYDQIDLKIWQKLFDAQEFKFEVADSSRCLLKVTNGCWIAGQTGAIRTYQKLVFFLDAVLAITLLAFLWVDRKRRAQQKERQRFTLQMLTHELRTPVTTLSVLMESMRDEFDAFNPQQQVRFLNMSGEIARLKNTMQMSYAYLQTDTISQKKIKMKQEKIELNSYLAEFLEGQELGDIQFNNSASKPVYIQAEKFWLSLCLTNLLRNSFEHGTAPVQVQVLLDDGFVRIEIQDQGVLDPLFLNQAGEPFQKGKNSHGLGLGLSIVRQILHEMRARLEIQSAPTRFSLVFSRLS